jgi:aldehyde dehydrogenase (NAD+)
MLSRLGGLIQKHAVELASIESRDTGKPQSVADADIVALARYFEFYGGAADKWHGETIPYLNGYLVALLREPHGVTGHILPWNYPAQMFGRTLAPSLAVGNAVVLKPAEDASDSSLRLAELVLEAGFPEGAVNIVTGRGPVAGAALASHNAVDFISFTGSPVVGQQVRSSRRITSSVHAGLGGKSPHLVFEDADFDAAVPIICRAIIQNTGQTCSAGSRVLIERRAYETVRRTARRGFAKLRAGSPAMNLDCGPIINSNRRRALKASSIALGRTDPLSRRVASPPVSRPAGSSRRRRSSARCRGRTRSQARSLRSVLAVMPFDDEATRSGWPATEYGSWPRYGRGTAPVSCASRGSCAAARCSSIPTAPARASNCRSAGRGRAATDVRRGSWRCTTSHA